MLFVGLFRVDRAKDLDFWAVLWQGQGPPADFKLVTAYNLLTDLRVFVFEAESIASIRWLDKLNMVGSFECHPALDQSEGYLAVVHRDLDEFARFQRGRGASEQSIAAQVAFRRAAMESPGIFDALRVAQARRDGIA